MVVSGVAGLLKLFVTPWQTLSQSGVIAMGSKEPDGLS